MECSKRSLTRWFPAIIVYIKKQERSQVNNLTLCLTELEEEKQTETKVSKRKEIIKIRAEINKIGRRKTIENIC